MTTTSQTLRLTESVNYANCTGTATVHATAFLQGQLSTFAAAIPATVTFATTASVLFIYYEYPAITLDVLSTCQTFVVVDLGKMKVDAIGRNVFHCLTIRDEHTGASTF